MKERKYKEDYTLEMQIDSRGREKRVPVYKGDWFQLSVSNPRKFKIINCIYCAAFVIFYLLYLEWNTPSTRCMYVFPLAACVLAPTAYWMMGLWQMLRSPEKMVRFQKEKGIGRLLRSAVACGILLALSCLCDLFFMLTNLRHDFMKQVPGFVWLVCAMLTAFGAFNFVRDAYHHIRISKTSKE